MKNKIAAAIISVTASFQPMVAKADQYSDYNSSWNQKMRSIERMHAEDERRQQQTAPSSGSDTLGTLIMAGILGYYFLSNASKSKAEPR